MKVKKIFRKPLKKKDPDNDLGNKWAENTEEDKTTDINTTELK